MNNDEVKRLLDDCSAELARVKTLIESLGIASNIAPYLTKYSIIRACGTIEQAFKSIIADFCSRRSKKQVKRFIEQRVRDSSMNPTYSNICKLLGNFDEDWVRNFKSGVDQSPNKSAKMDSLQSLVDARNNFAHGGNPSATIGNVLTYYSDGRKIIEQLDASVR